MSIFTNKSWYFSTAMSIILFCIVSITVMAGYLTFQSIFLTKIYALGQTGWTVLGMQILILIVSSWICVAMVLKNFWHKSFLKIDEAGIELNYLNGSLKPIAQSYKWTEIESMGDRLGKVQYELYISLKSMGDKKPETITLPYELWQSTFRVTKIKKVVEKYFTNSSFKTLPRVALIFGDLLLIVFMILFFSLVVYVSLAQFGGQGCNCF